MERVNLRLHGRTIDTVSYGYLIRLGISGGYELQVESRMELKGSDGASVLVDADATGSDQLSSLIGCSIVEAVAAEAGSLDVIASSDVRLHIGPGEDFESWTLTGPGGIRVVSLPGGELAKWGAEK